MSLGLLTGASSRWRRVIGTGSSGGKRVVAAVVRGPKRFILKGPSCIESSFLHLVRVRALADQNGSSFKGGLIQNRHFCTLVRVRALERPGYVQNRHFWGLWHQSLHVRSCHVTSRRVMSHQDMSRHVMSCHVMSCHVVSRHVMSCHVAGCHLRMRRVTSRHVVSRHVISCHVLSCHVMSCHVMSCYVMTCHVMSCQVISCHVMSGHVMSGHVLSRLAMHDIMTCNVRSWQPCHNKACHLTRHVTSGHGA